jgi:transcriptional regulator with XRE-family HTH domain
MSIQKMRLNRGWSQQQLADASGLSARTIQRIEAGHPASTETLKSIAAVFEVNFLTLSPELAMETKTDNTQAILERMAFNKVRRLRSYYMHLLVFLVMNLSLAALNLLTTPNYLWFIGVPIFWGMGLLIHTLTIFVFDNCFGAAWERGQVEKQLGRSL